MPNGVGSIATAAARFAAIGSSIAAARSSIIVVSWGWEAKGRWWRREGGAKERGRVKARGRPNRRRVEVVSWIGGDDELGEVAVREREE